MLRRHAETCALLHCDVTVHQAFEDSIMSSVITPSNVVSNACLLERFSIRFGMWPHEISTKCTVKAILQTTSPGQETPAA